VIYAAHAFRRDRFYVFTTVMIYVFTSEVVFPQRLTSYRCYHGLYHGFIYGLYVTFWFMAWLTSGLPKLVYAIWLILYSMQPSLGFVL